MSIYSDELRQTVVDTLSALSDQKAKLDAQEKGARLNCYYAIGARLLAEQNLAGTTEILENRKAASKKATCCDDGAINLLATVSQTGDDVTTSTSNMATVAANTQIAANAIMKVAADVGAALNAAKAELDGTPIFHQIKDVNEIINAIANEACAISLRAMNATSDAAEIISQATTAQAALVKTQVDNVLAAVAADYSQIAKLQASELQDTADDGRLENKALGVFGDALKHKGAIDVAWHACVKDVNLDLLIVAYSGSSISVKFKSLPDPYPGFKQKAPISVRSDAFKYYLTLVSADKLAMLTADKACQLFGMWDGKSSQFIPAEPSAKQSLINIDEKSLDVFGNRLKQGGGYAVCVYIQVNWSDARRFGENPIANMLTAPSEIFNLVTQFPEVKGSVTRQPDQSVIVDFDSSQFPGNPETSGKIEFRGILVGDDVNAVQTVCGDGKTDKLFDMTIALQVPSTNYKAAHGKGRIQFIFDKSSVDCLGGVVLPKTPYRVYVLAVPDSDIANVWSSSLTELAKPFEFPGDSDGIEPSEEHAIPSRPAPTGGKGAAPVEPK